MSETVGQEIIYNNNNNNNRKKKKYILYLCAVLLCQYTVRCKNIWTVLSFTFFRHQRCNM